MLGFFRVFGGQRRGDAGAFGLSCGAKPGRLPHGWPQTAIAALRGGRIGECVEYVGEVRIARKAGFANLTGSLKFLGILVDVMEVRHCVS